MGSIMKQMYKRVLGNINIIPALMKMMFEQQGATYMPRQVWGPSASYGRIQPKHINARQAWKNRGKTKRK